MSEEKKQGFVDHCVNHLRELFSVTEDDHDAKEAMKKFFESELKDDLDDMLIWLNQNLSSYFNKVVPEFQVMLKVSLVTVDCIKFEFTACKKIDFGFDNLLFAAGEVSSSNTEIRVRCCSTGFEVDKMVLTTEDGLLALDKQVEFIINTLKTKLLPIAVER